VPFTLALLIMPMPIVLGAFTIGAVIRIIYPKTFNQDVKLSTTLSHAMGIHAAIYAIGYAILLADPAMMALHLGICTAAFMLSKEIQEEGYQEKAFNQATQKLNHSASSAHSQLEGH
jgi:hypothetical protein